MYEWTVKFKEGFEMKIPADSEFMVRQEVKEHLDALGFGDCPIASIKVGRRLFPEK